MKKKTLHLTSLSIALLLAYGLPAHSARADTGFSILSPEPQAGGNHSEPPPSDNDNRSSTTPSKGFFSFFKRPDKSEADPQSARSNDTEAAGKADTPPQVVTPVTAQPEASQPEPVVAHAEPPAPVPAAGEKLQPLPVVEIAEPRPMASSIDLTIPADDLWERMRKGYAIPDLNSDLVLQHQQTYMNRPEYLRRIVERSRRYMYHILVQLEARGMPTELALLPMVESAYNPMAASPARAVGLWQFIPSTGRNFKLEQNWWMDQRRDIVASTSAALDYLQYIYEMHGDWHLALASYNWGEGAVTRAINKNKAQGLPTDYLSLTMPTETRNYVPKLQALKNIFSNPKLVAELDLPETPNRPYFSTIAAPGNIDVKLAAKLANVPMDEFIALNPAHNRPIIKGNVELALPSDKIETFKANLDNHDQPLSSWRVYSLKSGERLDKIASRFNISLASLKSANGIDKKTRIKPGFTLLVPSAGGAETISDLSMLRLPSADLTPEKPAGVKTAHNSRHYQTQKGDTLATIAKRHNVSVSDIKQWNHLKSDRLSAGTRLALAGGADTSDSGKRQISPNTRSVQDTPQKQDSKASVRVKARESASRKLADNHATSVKRTNTRTVSKSQSGKRERATKIARND